MFHLCILLEWRYPTLPLILLCCQVKIQSIKGLKSSRIYTEIHKTFHSPSRWMEDMAYCFTTIGVETTAHSRSNTTFAIMHSQGCMWNALQCLHSTYMDRPAVSKFKLSCLDSVRKAKTLQQLIGSQCRNYKLKMTMIN